jgi:uncharacterized protein with GYD domain
MATYIALMKFTDEGIRGVKETVRRAEAFKEKAKKSGVTIKETYWVTGRYDAVSIVEAADDLAATALALTLGTLGNVHTETLRAFGPAEMKHIIEKMG